MLRTGRWIGIILVLCGASARANMVISLSAGSGTALTGQAQADAMAAAAAWTALFSDPITVNVQISFADLGSSSGILASTTTYETTGYYYSQVQAALNAESSQPGKGALANLPSASTLMNTALPTGYGLANNGGDPRMSLATADARALGLTASVPVDASIQINQNYYSGYASGDDTGSFDFTSVVTHELGHALGFVSAEDQVVAGFTSVLLTPLDLYRFYGTSVPVSFMDTTRDLDPTSAPQVLSDGASYYPVCPGVTSPGSPGSDTNCQASHYVEGVGVMQWGLPASSVQPITSADIWAMQMIGYDLAVPEPGTVAFLAAGIFALAILARRRNRRALS